MSNYLSICPMNMIHQKGGLYFATLTPKNYREWKEIDPYVLLLEGIHQFCVRITMLYIYGNHHITLSKHQGQILPSQVRVLKVHQNVTYYSCQIEGTLENHGKHTCVTLEVRDGVNFIADGQIIVSQV